jgi:dTDP-4-dehydrorhamnose reductase|tara:strand:+ start:975 stop:1856 length:882 start_codon:yes stop_codon:yes gene_type:complete
MKLLVLGGSGLIGHAIVKKSKNEFDVLTTYYRNSVAIDNVNSFECYFPNDLDKLEEVVKKEKPDVIVNTIGYSNIDFCESNKNNTEMLHVETTERICNICESNDSKQIFLSSDYVFDGEKGDYSENDIPNPVNFYGLSKLKAEQLILKSPINTVIRTSVIYDWDYRARFFNSVIKNLQNNQEFKATTDVYNSVTLLDNLVESIFKVIKLDQNGIFHVADSTCMNRYEFAKIIAKKFQLDEKLIKTVSVQDDSKNIAKRPKNACLNNSKAKKELGLNFGTIEEGVNMVFMKSQL